MIPVRSVAESFGFTCDWDDSAKKVTLKKGGKTSSFTLSGTNAMVGGKKVALSAAPEIIGGSFFAPADALAKIVDKNILRFDIRFFFEDICNSSCNHFCFSRAGTCNYLKVILNFRYCFLLF